MRNLICYAGLALLAFTISAGCPREAAPDVAGRWVGTASSSIGELYYEWNLIQSRAAVEGTVYLALPDRSAFGRYEVTGTISGNTLDFEGGNFLENIPPPGGTWCAASGALEFLDQAPDILSGIWICVDGSTGQVNLERFP